MWVIKQTTYKSTIKLFTNELLLIKSIDKDVINETDSYLINIFLSGSSKYEYHINSKIFNFSVDFILKTENFSGPLF